MLILGLDPGSLHTGYGLIEKRGSQIKLVALGRFSSPRDHPLSQRLAHLAGCLDELLARHPPEVAALESPFHGMNSRSLIVLAQARGALLAALGRRGIDTQELAPAQVKLAVTGNGRATKEQVARMVGLLVPLDPAVRLAADATDALAIALCCAQRLRFDRLAAAVRAG